MTEAHPPTQRLNLYRWEGVDALGNLQSGELLSADELSVHQQLFTQALQPVNVKYQQRVRAAYWKGNDLIAFIRQLATLLQTGLPLVNSLTLLANEHPKAPWRCILQTIFTARAGGHAAFRYGWAVSAGFSGHLPSHYRYRRNDRAA
ncbi:type II secretory pathway component PulF [Ewingella americana]